MFSKVKDELNAFCRTRSFKNEEVSSLFLFGRLKPFFYGIATASSQELIKRMQTFHLSLTSHYSMSIQG